MALTTEEVSLCNQSLGKIGARQFTFGDVTSPQSIQSLLHFDQTRDMLLRSFEWQFSKTRLRLVSAWLTDTVYTTDRYVWQSGLLYKCAVAHTSGTFATDLTSVYWTLQSTVSAWVTLTVYAVGDVVTTNALYYKCLTAHTAGTFATDLAAGYWIATTTKPTNVFGYNYDLPSGCLRLVEFIDDDNVDWRLETNTILTDETEVDIVYVDQVDTTTKWDSLFTELLICHLAKRLIGPLAGSGPGTASLREDLDVELKTLTKRARLISRQEGRGNTSSTSWNEARHT